jgi:hypothetical protein
VLPIMNTDAGRPPTTTRPWRHASAWPVPAPRITRRGHCDPHPRVSARADRRAKARRSTMLCRVHPAASRQRRSSSRDRVCLASERENSSPAARTLLVLSRSFSIASVCERDSRSCENRSRQPRREHLSSRPVDHLAPLRPDREVVSQPDAQRVGALTVARGWPTTGIVEQRPRRTRRPPSTFLVWTRIPLAAQGCGRDRELFSPETRTTASHAHILFFRRREGRKVRIRWRNQCFH